MSTPVGRQADARRPGVPKENLHAQSTGSTAGGKSAALRPRSNGHDSSMVQELTEQVRSCTPCFVLAAAGFACLCHQGWLPDSAACSRSIEKARVITNDTCIKPLLYCRTSN